MDFLVLLMASLLQAIQSLLQETDKVFLARDLKPLWLLHVDGFVDIAIEVGIFEIDLVELEVVNSSYS
jgi:hypothetical protein